MLVCFLCGQIVKLVLSSFTLTSELTSRRMYYHAGYKSVTVAVYCIIRHSVSYVTYSIHRNALSCSDRHLLLVR